MLSHNNHNTRLMIMLNTDLCKIGVDQNCLVSVGLKLYTKLNSSLDIVATAYSFSQS